jgi:hypothetical protein
MSLETLGMQGFRAWIRANPSKYTLLAVQAPLEQLINQLTQWFNVEDWQRQVNLKGTLASLPGVPILQFKDSPWTIAYWAIGRTLNLKREGLQLSNVLDTKVINIWESDTSGWTEWLVWQGGDEKEGAERMPPDDHAYFRSSLRVRTRQNFDGLNASKLRQKLLLRQCKKLH